MVSRNLEFLGEPEIYFLTQKIHFHTKLNVKIDLFDDDINKMMLSVLLSKNPQELTNISANTYIGLMIINGYDGTYSMSVDYTLNTQLEMTIADSNPESIWFRDYFSLLNKSICVKHYSSMSSLLRGVEDIRNDVINCISRLKSINDEETVNNFYETLLQKFNKSAEAKKKFEYFVSCLPRSETFFNVYHIILVCSIALNNVCFDKTSYRLIRDLLLTEVNKL